MTLKQESSIVMLCIRKKWSTSTQMKNETNLSETSQSHSKEIHSFFSNWLTNTVKYCTMIYKRMWKVVVMFSLCMVGQMPTQEKKYGQSQKTKRTQSLLRLTV